MLTPADVADTWRYCGYPQPARGQRFANGAEALDKRINNLLPDEATYIAQKWLLELRKEEVDIYGSVTGLIIDAGDNEYRAQRLAFCDYMRVQPGPVLANAMLEE